MLGLRHKTQDHYNTTTCESYSPHNLDTDGCGTYVTGWFCSILDAKQVRKKLNNVRKKCYGTLLKVQAVLPMTAVLKFYEAPT
jgi:hypothetical protein